MRTKRSFPLATLVLASAPLMVLTASPAFAQQDHSQFDDVPRGHWAYDALEKLAAIGAVEGYPPTGTFKGSQEMTRYEFAMVVARLLNSIPVYSPEGQDWNPKAALAELENRPTPDISRQGVNDLIGALKREFLPEEQALGLRVDGLENRVAKLDRPVEVPRLSTTLALSTQTGYANYIDNGRGGRTFLNPLLLHTNPFGFNALFKAGIIPPKITLPGIGDIDLGLPNAAFKPSPTRGSGGFQNRKFSQTETSIRLHDRVSDTLSLTAELRSLGANQEDPWAGDSKGGLYLREGYALADFSARHFGKVKALSATVGRQRTKIGQGLLYDNQLSPTDQIRADFDLGPVAFTGFYGTTNNQTGVGQVELDPYVSQGAVFYLNTGMVANDRAVGFPGFGVGTIDNSAPVDLGNLDLDTDFDRNSFSNQRRDDQEGLLHASTTLFKVGDAPVRLGYTRLLSGFREEKSDSLDLDFPLLGRQIGVEYVRNLQTAFGKKLDGHRDAILVDVPLIQAPTLDLKFAYGQAGNQYIYNVISAANPYVRSYGEAIFDRPIALGSPLMSDLNGGSFLAAKQTFDVKGTLRLPFLRRVPLDFRWYTARSGGNLTAAVVLTQNNGRRANLGQVYSLGTTMQLTSGLAINVMGGIYNPSGSVPTLRYLRVDASVGF